MTQHVKLDLYSFRDAIRETEAYNSIKNSAIKKLYFGVKIVERLYDNYLQGVLYGTAFIKRKPSLQIRDIRIICEILAT